MPGPARVASCSVASLIRAAVGITPMADVKKTSGAEAEAMFSPIAIGMKTDR